MNREIDASNIIAAIAELSHDMGQFTLPYEKIRNIAITLERTKPTLLVSYDRISIDAFRCSMGKNVVMEEDCLVIKKIEEIKWKLKLLMPSDEIVEIISSVEREQFK